MNNIFSGNITRDNAVYDYSGVWTRRSGGVDWKAVVRHADVVCRPSGTVDDGLSDAEVRKVIQELVRVGVDDALADPAQSARVNSRSSA